MYLPGKRCRKARRRGEGVSQLSFGVEEQTVYPIKRVGLERGSVGR